MSKTVRRLLVLSLLLVALYLSSHTATADRCGPPQCIIGDAVRTTSVYLPIVTR